MKKQITKLMTLFLAVMMLFTILPADAQAASNVKLNKSKITLYTGGTTVLKVTGTSRKVKFTSSRKSVATVSSKGKVTAKKAGKAIITAKVGSKKLKCTVTVKKEKLKLNKSKATLSIGKSVTLKATGTSRKVKFTSSKKSVATVNSKGKVTAKKVGTTIITAKVGKQKATCKVMVKKLGQTANNTNVSIYWNGEKTIKAAGTTKTVTWESSSKSIVTVKSSGVNAAVLTGKKVGRATITAKVDGKVFQKYTVTVKMKTTPLTEKEEGLMDWIVDKYDDWETLTGDITLKKLGLTRNMDSHNLWNTHKRALASARKLLPGRDIHIIDVDSMEKCWAKQHELEKQKVRYVYHPGTAIAHDHGDIEKYSVAWIE